MLRILGLDLGTATGWALWVGGLPEDPQSRLMWGTWHLDRYPLPPAKVPMALLGQLQCGEVSTEGRFWALWEHLREIGPLSAVVYEDVRFLRGLGQSRLWCGFRGVVLATYPDIPVFGIPAPVLKLAATGYGQATKADMVQAAQRLVAKYRWPGAIDDDNQADAIMLVAALLGL